MWPGLDSASAHAPGQAGFTAAELALKQGIPAGVHRRLNMMNLALGMLHSWCIKLGGKSLSLSLLGLSFIYSEKVLDEAADLRKQIKAWMSWTTS